MAKTETVVKKEAKVLTPGEELVASWNRVVDLLIELEEAWEVHKVSYYKNRTGIVDLHPVQQRILNRVVHRQPFQFFLDDVSRDARTGVKKLRITEVGK